MRRVWRHADWNNIILSANSIKFRSQIAFIAIKNKHLISSHYTAICVRNEVINKLIYANLICCLSIIANIDSLIIWKNLKLAFLRVFLYFKNHVRR
jgi:hypothetical protein